MFFNETDLLRIRYSCLKDFVDYIVVIESNQTFTGNRKQHILPTLQFNPGSSVASAKVITISRSEFFYSYDDLVCQLRQNTVSDFSQEECLMLLSKVLEFPLDIRSSPSLYLDRFQRECCSVYINRLASDGDLILFSDADELPDNILDLCKQTSESLILSIHSVNTNLSIILISMRKLGLARFSAPKKLYCQIHLIIIAKKLGILGLLPKS